MGSLGADEAGEDMTVGRTNKSEERTILVATGAAPNGYADDFVLSVSIQNDAVLTSTPGRGVDAIHAKGTLPSPTGGAMGTIPAGNGIIAQGINGVAGYVHATSRNRPLEIPSAQACSASALRPLQASSAPVGMALSELNRLRRAISLSKQRKKPAY